MDVRPFHSQHLIDLALQPAQAWMRAIVSDKAYALMFAQAQSLSLFIGGRVAAVAALVTIWPGRAHLSALVAGDVGPAGMLALHREALRRLAACPVRRIEAAVDGEFEPGHRWLRLLGFQCETPAGMPGYLPTGGTAYLYARTK